MDEKKKDYTRFSVSIPTHTYEEFEKIRTHLNITRSDAIHKGMKLYLKNRVEMSENSDKIEILGTISYLEKAHVHHYNIIPESEILSHSHEGEHKNEHEHEHEHKQEHKQSHIRSIDKLKKGSESYYYPKEQQEFIEINALQHNFLYEIISTTHIHTGPEKCMIVMAVRGNLKRIHLLVNSLRAFKTIENLTFIKLESKSA
ncbi:MAG: CopG family ribbon-helix-helix protein [Promethearchaeota archaeon]